MRKYFILGILAAAGISISTLIACTSASSKEAEPKIPGIEERIKRGEYLVATVGCDDCHSPKRMGPNGPEIIPELRLSGYPASKAPLKVDQANLKNGWMLLMPDLTAAVGPWGMSFAANLTSDETGIGNWQESQFIKAIREGKWMGMDNTRPILPPMPWFVYKNMSDEDLKSIFAYLKTVPAVENIPPAPLALKDIK